MGLTKGFEALGAGLALLRKQRKPRSVDVYANFHVHAAGRTIAGARQSAMDVAERNFRALNQMKNLARRNRTCSLRSDGAPCRLRSTTSENSEGKACHLAAGFPN